MLNCQWPVKWDESVQSDLPAIGLLVKARLPVIVPVSILNILELVSTLDPIPKYNLGAKAKYDLPRLKS